MLWMHLYTDHSPQTCCSVLDLENRDELHKPLRAKKHKRKYYPKKVAYNNTFLILLRCSFAFFADVSFRPKTVDYNPILCTPITPGISILFGALNLVVLYWECPLTEVPLDRH